MNPKRESRKRSMEYWLSLIGSRFGRITIIKFSHVKHSIKYYECVCDCGKNLVLPIKTLKNGNTKSCGCLKRDIIINRNKARMHEELPVKVKYKKEYGTWIGMKARCCNPSEDAYMFYGGRGIKVCDRWLSSFYNFIEDMGTAPSKKHSIERIDNNGDYEKLNCVWATALEQNNNKRDTILVEHQGKKKSLRGWCTELNKNYQTVYSRLKHGHTPIEALNLIKK